MIRTANRWRSGTVPRHSPPDGHRPGDGVRDPDRVPPEGRAVGFEAMVAAYRAIYPDEQRQNWVERRLRAWKAGQR